MAQKTRGGEKTIPLSMTVGTEDEKRFQDFMQQGGFSTQQSAFSELLRLAEQNGAFVKDQKENSGSDPEDEEPQKVESSKKGKAGKGAKGKGKGTKGADVAEEEKDEDMNGDKPESKKPVTKKRAPAKKAAAKKGEQDQGPEVNVDDEVRPAANKGKRGKKAAKEPIAEGLEDDEDIGGNGKPDSPMDDGDVDEDRPMAKKQHDAVQDSDTNDDSQEPLVNIAQRMTKKKSASSVADALQGEPDQQVEAAGDGKKSAKRKPTKAAKGKKEEEDAHLDEPGPSGIGGGKPKRGRAAKGKPVKYAEEDEEEAY